MSYGSLGAWYTPPKTAMLARIATTTAVKSAPTPSAAQIAEMSAKNMIWVPATSSARGHWETRRSTTRTGAVRVTATRDSDMTPAQQRERKKRFERMALAKKCKATGMPEGLVKDCVEGLQAGVSMDKVMSTLQEQAGAAQAAAAAASAVPAAAPVGPVASAKPKSRVLLYGGIAAVGILGLFLVLRKKR